MHIQPTALDPVVLIPIDVLIVILLSKDLDAYSASITLRAKYVQMVIRDLL